MEPFNFVIFGFTSNLAQLKIIPALYDMEEKGNLPGDAKIIGIGRRDIDIAEYINTILKTPNRHHQHSIDQTVADKLILKSTYMKEDIKGGEDYLYKKLQKISGNTLFYIATYPELYEGIFRKLKEFGLNKDRGGWSKIMLEKPIGHDLKSAINLDSLLLNFFTEDRIFRIDHYLGKSDLQKVFQTNIDPENVDHIKIAILEDFGVGKRGVYYDATGALIDMGQNHCLEMIAAVAKEDKTVSARERVLEHLVPEPDSLVFGQYDGYKNEENVNPESSTDTFFAFRTHLSNGKFKNIPILVCSGKKLPKNETNISVIYKNGQEKIWIIESTGVGADYDPYERLIMEAVAGHQFYFVSSKEVEYSWRFIDSLSSQKKDLIIYQPGDSGFLHRVAAEFTS